MTFFHFILYAHVFLVFSRFRWQRPVLSSSSLDPRSFHGKKLLLDSDLQSLENRWNSGSKYLWHGFDWPKRWWLDLKESLNGNIVVFLFKKNANKRQIKENPLFQKNANKRQIKENPLFQKTSRLCLLLKHFIFPLAHQEVLILLRPVFNKGEAFSPCFTFNDHFGGCFRRYSWTDVTYRNPDLPSTWPDAHEFLSDAWWKSRHKDICGRKVLSSKLLPL